MGTITIENVPESVIKTFGTRMRYTKDIIFPEKNNAEDMTLFEYIQSDAYRNEKKIYYTNPVEFLSDLRKGV